MLLCSLYRGGLTYLATATHRSTGALILRLAYGYEVAQDQAHSVGGKWAPSQSPASGEWLTDFWAGEWVANAASAGDWLLKL